MAAHKNNWGHRNLVNSVTIFYFYMNLVPMEGWVHQPHIVANIKRNPSYHVQHLRCETYVLMFWIGEPMRGGSILYHPSILTAFQWTWRPKRRIFLACSLVELFHYGNQSRGYSIGGRPLSPPAVPRFAARSSQSNPMQGSGPEVLKRERGHVTTETGVAEVGVFRALQPNVLLTVAMFSIGPFHAKGSCRVCPSVCSATLTPSRPQCFLRRFCTVSSYPVSKDMNTAQVTTFHSGISYLVLRMALSLTYDLLCIWFGILAQ